MVNNFLENFVPVVIIGTLVFYNQCQHPPSHLIPLTNINGIKYHLSTLARYTYLHFCKVKVIETSGDELYAVFGNSTSIKEASDAAIAAGFEIIEELDHLNKIYLSVYFLKEFEVGIGIHSGKVIVGRFNLGNHNKTHVMGLAVNIASRLQDSTKHLNNNFVASAELMSHSSHSFSNNKAEMNLKGISNSFAVHLLGRPYRSR